jgi:hypothetical protein
MPCSAPNVGFRCPLSMLPIYRISSPLASASSCCVILRCNRSLLTAWPRSRTACVNRQGLVGLLRDFGDRSRNRKRETRRSGTSSRMVHGSWVKAKRTGYTNSGSNNDETSQRSLQWLEYFSVIVRWCTRPIHDKARKFGMARIGRLLLVSVLRTLQIMSSLKKRKGKHAPKRNGDRNNSKRPTAGQKAEII